MIMAKKKNSIFNNSRYMKRLIFYISVLALPLLQFLIFYLYVNFDSIILAFEHYEISESGGYVSSFAGFENFKNVFEILKNKPQLLENSLILFVCEFFIGIPLALLFSYYIYKHKLFAGWFRVLLFLPQIISGTVFVIITKILLTDAFPSSHLPDLLVNAKVATRRATLIVFTLFMSFGTNVLLFTGAMTSIPPSLIEASELDGCNPIQEFINVTIPCIFPTIVSFIIMTIGTIFTNQMFLFTFAFQDDKLATIGYYLYSQSQSTAGGLVPSRNDVASYGTLSAFSLMITIILFPLTLGIRKLLTKFGPSTR